MISSINKVKLPILSGFTYLRTFFIATKKWPQSKKTIFKTKDANGFNIIEPWFVEKLSKFLCLLHSKKNKVNSLNSSQDLEINNMKTFKFSLKSLRNLLLLQSQNMSFWLLWWTIFTQDHALRIKQNKCQKW